MTFLAPAFFYVALGVAGLVAGLHFIVTRQPLSSPLPTVRFVPRSQVRVVTLARPEDLRLLLLRVAAILLIGAALARPVLVPHRRSLVRIVLADGSRDVGSIAAVRDSARSLLGSGDVLVAFDSTARVEEGGSDAGRLAVTGREGRLSSALIAALRTASRIRDRGDSFALVVVSPFRAAEWDGATQAIRALWPGRIRLVPVGATADSLAPPPGIALGGAADDPLAIAVSAAGIPASDAGVRVVRGVSTAADSAWAAAGRRTLVRWPVSGPPPGWVARPRPDTAGAVVAGEAAVVYPLERRWQLDTAAHLTRVAARWVDGTAAAVEHAVGPGCIRDVAVPVPAPGDLVVRPAFTRLVRELVAPCQGEAAGLAARPAALAALAGGGPLAAHDAIPAPDTVATPLAPWLLGAALLLLLAEPLLRRGSAPRWAALEASGAPAGSAKSDRGAAA